MRQPRDRSQPLERDGQRRAARERARLRADDATAAPDEQAEPRKARRWACRARLVLQLALREVLEEQQRGEARRAQERAVAADLDRLAERPGLLGYVRGEEGVGALKESGRGLGASVPSTANLGLPALGVDSFWREKPSNKVVDCIDCDKERIPTDTAAWNHVQLLPVIEILSAKNPA